MAASRAPRVSFPRSQQEGERLGRQEARLLGGGGVPGARYRPGARLRTDHERATALDQGRGASAHPGVGAERLPSRCGVTRCAPGTNGFTQIWNALIVDHRIGATAFRLAAYLGSKTEDWTIREQNVCETLGIGQSAYRSALRQLDTAGYIKRGKTEQDQRTGRFHTEPPTLSRRLIVADPGEAPRRTEDASSIVGHRHIGTQTSVLGAVTQHQVLNTETQQEDAVGFGSRPDGRSQPGGKRRGDQKPCEGAPAPEREDLCPLGCGRPRVPSAYWSAHLGNYHAGAKR
jgi:hypothetical protein